MENVIHIFIIVFQLYKHEVGPMPWPAKKHVTLTTHFHVSVEKSLSLQFPRLKEGRQNADHDVAPNRYNGCGCEIG
jgi:hypothetical protein